MSLSRHKQTFHQDLIKTLFGPNCQFCMQVIGNRKAIRKHKQTIQHGMITEGEVLCDYCSGIFQASFLGHHINFQHKPRSLAAFEDNVINK